MGGDRLGSEYDENQDDENDSDDGYDYCNIFFRDDGIMTSKYSSRR